VAIIGVESFSWTTNIDDISTRWNTVTGAAVLSAANGRFGNTALRLASPTATQIFLMPAGPIAAGCVGVAFRNNGLNLVNNEIIYFNDGGTNQVSLGLIPSQQLQIKRNGTVLATGTRVLNSSSWYYLEIAVTIAPAGGTVNVYIDGVLEISFTGNTRASAASQFDRVVLQGATGSVTLYSDLYFKDDATALGDSRTALILPSADATPLDWTTSSGVVHFSLVNEVPPNGDASYVASSTPGQIDLYEFQDVTFTGVVRAVQVSLWARKDDAAVRQVAVRYQQGASNYSGATQTLTTTFLSYRQVWPTDPNTGAAWLTGAINSARFGVLEVA
jgi:hypothetical protein